MVQEVENAQAVTKCHHNNQVSTSKYARWKSLLADPQLGQAHPQKFPGPPQPNHNNLLSHLPFLANFLLPSLQPIGCCQSYRYERTCQHSNCGKQENTDPVWLKDLSLVPLAGWENGVPSNISHPPKFLVSKFCFSMM